MNPWSLLRIVVATAVVSVILVAGLKWAFPLIALPNLWPMALALPFILLMVVVQFGILTLIPPIVTIRANKLVLPRGRTVQVIDSDAVKGTYLTIHPNDRIRLRVCYTEKSGNKRSRSIGVPTTVDLTRLSELLPVSPVVRDARTR